MTIFVLMENQNNQIIPNPFEDEVLKTIKDAVENNTPGIYCIYGMRSGKTQLARFLYAKTVEDAKLIPEQTFEEQNS